MSWIWNDTLGGNVSAAGKAEGVRSKPTSWHVEGRLLATSKSQMPVPVPMSAILSVGELSGMFGWIRKPKVLVVAMCCSSRLWMGFSFGYLADRILTLAVLVSLH
jgi:hypothetical protein